MIKHIVMIKMKGNNLNEIEILVNALRELPLSVDEIGEYEVGVNITDSERAYDIVLISSFESEEDLEKYRVHPDHQKVVGIIKEYAENTIVVDYRI